MKDARIIGLAVVAAGLTGAFWFGLLDRGAAAAGSLDPSFLLVDSEEEGRPVVGSSRGRRPVASAATPASPDGSRIEDWMLRAGVKMPQSREDLERLVAWMRTLDEEELLRLTNAQYDFQESELIALLQELAGDWVVPALGDLAVVEGNPLLKAILVEGLVGSASWERMEDERLLPVLDTLMAQLSLGRDDPFEVGAAVIFTSWASCVRQGQDYALFASIHLLSADNPLFVITGYDLMGMCPGAEPVLEEMVTAHPNAEGRMGALEGLRAAGVDGRIAPGRITALGLSALEAETNERNRLLLYEMILAAGGEEGVQAIEELVRGGDGDELARTAEMLAMKMEPARAVALFQDALAAPGLQGEERQALYRALGLVEGDEGVAFLLDLATDPEAEGSRRLDGLRGLWSREVDDVLADELRTLLTDEKQTELRAEALRMLVYGRDGDPGVDLRELGALDPDPVLRAEAILLAAVEPSEGTRAWLEERMLSDDSLDVKAAALGALVAHAHYGGDGDAVLGYLDRARRFTDDEEALAMLDRGEDMVRSHDSRRLDLELAREAKFWTDVAQLTTGPARRSFAQRGHRIERMVQALRGPTR